MKPEHDTPQEDATLRTYQDLYKRLDLCTPYIQGVMEFESADRSTVKHPPAKFGGEYMHKTLIGYSLLIESFFIINYFNLNQEERALLSDVKNAVKNIYDTSTGGKCSSIIDRAIARKSVGSIRKLDTTEVMNDLMTQGYVYITFINYSDQTTPLSHANIIKYSKEDNKYYRTIYNVSMHNLRDIKKLDRATQERLQHVIQSAFHQHGSPERYYPTYNAIKFPLNPEYQSEQGIRQLIKTEVNYSHSRGSNNNKKKYKDDTKFFDKPIILDENVVVNNQSVGNCSTRCIREMLRDSLGRSASGKAIFRALYDHITTQDVSQILESLQYLIIERNMIVQHNNQETSNSITEEHNSAPQEQEINDKKIIRPKIDILPKLVNTILANNDIKKYGYNTKEMTKICSNAFPYINKAQNLTHNDLATITQCLMISLVDFGKKKIKSSDDEQQLILKWQNTCANDKTYITTDVVRDILPIITGRKRSDLYLIHDDTKTIQQDNSNQAMHNSIGIGNIIATDKIANRIYRTTTFFNHSPLVWQKEEVGIWENTLEEVQALCAKAFSAENSQNRLKEKDIKILKTCFFICRKVYGKITTDNEQNFIKRWQHLCISNPLRKEPSKAMKKIVHDTRLQFEPNVSITDIQPEDKKTQELATSRPHEEILSNMINMKVQAVKESLKPFIPDTQNDSNISPRNHSERFQHNSRKLSIRHKG